MSILKKFSTFFLVILFFLAVFSSFSQAADDQVAIDQDTMEMFIEMFPNYNELMTKDPSGSLQGMQKEFEAFLKENNISMEEFEDIARKIITSFTVSQMQQYDIPGFDMKGMISQIPEESRKQVIDEMNTVQEYMPQLQELLQGSIMQMPEMQLPPASKEK